MTFCQHMTCNNNLYLLSQNCPLFGTDQVYRQIADLIFAPSKGYCLINFLQYIFLDAQF